jgi:hypothetical protein
MTKNIDVDILYSHEVVSRENDIFCVMCKKIKFGAKIGVARDIFCFIYTRHKNYRFSAKLGRAHRMVRCSTC